MEFIPIPHNDPVPTVETLPSHIHTPHGTVYEPDVVEEDFFPPIESNTIDNVPSFDVQLFAHVCGALGVALFIVLSIVLVRKKCPGDELTLKIS